MRKYTEAQNRATQKYIKSHLDTISIRVPKGKREYYKKAAEMAGMSLASFIVKSMDRMIEEVGIGVLDEKSESQEDPE